MKICVLAERNELFGKIFSEEDFANLGKLGTVETWDGKKDIKEFAAGADIIITSWGSPKIDSALLGAAPGLKFVFHAAGSIKSCVDAEVMNKGVRVSSASGVLGRNVAVTTFGWILSSVKKIPWWSEYIKEEKDWRGDKKLLQYTEEISGVNTGVISMSIVGKNLVSLLKSVTDKIFVYDPYWSEGNISEYGGKKVESLYEIAEKCDIIALCAPLLKATEGMLDKTFFRKMKDGAVLINTARGAIIDEGALIEELGKERIFACLDVTNPEPPVPESPLRSLKNVVLSPHIAGLVNSGLGEIGKFCAAEVKRFIDGKPLLNEITPGKLDITA
ncbi:MAG: hydroxyacid dehydrogenase [Candidatus Omnitrophica bacterium]|nr:hydroxyacid dehydrogenase [Candidatus Omnitrophota bacterium]